MFNNITEIDSRLKDNDAIWNQLMHELFFCDMAHEQDIFDRIDLVNKQRGQLLKLKQQVQGKVINDKST